MIKPIDNRALPDGVRHELKLYESGQRLLPLVASPGWQDVLTILDEEIQSSEKKLLASRDSSPDEVFGLLREIQGMRKLRSRLESTAKARTTLANDPPASIQDYTHL